MPEGPLRLELEMTDPLLRQVKLCAEFTEGGGGTPVQPVPAYQHAPIALREPFYGRLELLGLQPPRDFATQPMTGEHRGPPPVDLAIVASSA